MSAQLPTGAPLCAQFLAGALPHLPEPAQESIRLGRVNNRTVRGALAELATQSAVPLLPSRSELDRAARYLARIGLLR